MYDREGGAVGGKKINARRDVKSIEEPGDDAHM